MLLVIINVLPYDTVFLCNSIPHNNPGQTSHLLKTAAKEKKKSQRFFD